MFAALWGTPSGLTLQPPGITGTVYKARTTGNPGTNSSGPDNLAEADAYRTFGDYRGSASYPVINLGSGGRVGGDSALPLGTPSDHFVVLAMGLIHVAPGQEGNWTFFTNSDDGSRLRINGVNVILDNFVQGPQDSAYASFNFPVAGDYPVEYTGFDKDGGESFEVWYYPGLPNSTVKGQGIPGPNLHLLGDPAGPLAVIQTPPAPGLPFPGLNLEFTTVGDPGNPADTVDGDGATPGVQNYGAVAYPFLIATTEVTNHDYAAFLNDVDPSGLNNPFDVWNDDMGGTGPNNVADGWIARDTASGIANGKHYSIAPDSSVSPSATYPNRPVVHLTFLSAMRFANWLHNGGPGAFGQLGNSAMNTGAYTLTGNVITDGNAARNAPAKYWIPNGDEWYKAAYYDPTRKPSTNSTGRTGSNPGNYWVYPYLADNNPYSVFGPPFQKMLLLSNSKNIYNTIDVKSYTDGTSHYGTYDQGGNAAEWIENTIFAPTRRGARGGGYSSQGTDDTPSIRSIGPVYFLDPANYLPASGPEPYPIGFRVAATASAQPLGCVKPPSNMVLWLPFDESSGSKTKNAVTASPAYDGTLIGSPAHIAGYVSNALQFDGATRYVSVPDYPAINFGTSTSAAPDFSVDAWIMRDANVNGVQSIIDKREQTPPEGGYHMYLFDNRLGFRIAGNNVAGNFNLPGTIPLGVWTHVAVTVKRNDVAGGRFYVNGAEQAASRFDTIPYNGSMTNTRPFVVGSRSSSISGFIRAKIDEVEVFSRALTPGEVKSIYDAGIAGKCLYSCSVSPVLTFGGASPSTITATAQICNASGVDQTFTYSFGPVRRGPGCTRNGPTIFSPPSGTITVLAGKCESFPVTINRPLDFNGSSQLPFYKVTACYEMVLSNAAGTVEFSRCRGTLVDSNAVLKGGDLNGGGLIGLSACDLMAGCAVSVQLKVTNTTGSAISQMKYEFLVLREDNTADVQAVSLNNEAPGTSVAGTLSLAAGASTDIPVNAMFMQNDPLHTYTLLMLADMGGNGVMHPFGSYRLENLVLPNPQLQSAVSRKTHGAAGIFDISLPLTGSPGIECRGSGPAGTHTLILTFNNEILTGSVSVTAGTGSVSGAPTFNSVTNEMTVNLTGINNQQAITVTLSGMKDIAGQALANTSVTMGFLLGDANGNGVVNSTDIVLVKAQSGATTDANNFRRDVNASGGVNITDVVLTKSRSGASLPP